MVSGATERLSCGIRRFARICDRKRTGFRRREWHVSRHAAGIAPRIAGNSSRSVTIHVGPNVPHFRKRLHLHGLEAMEMLAEQNEKFDLIRFSDVLRHCIDKSFHATRKVQSTVLSAAANVLSPNGRIIVCERVFNSYVTDEFSNRLIYELTRNKMLADIVKLGGANTAGSEFVSCRKDEFDKCSRKAICL